MYRERFQLTNYDPAAKAGDRPLGQVLPEVVRKLGLSQDLWLKSLTDNWGVLMGSQVAQHSRPGKVEHNTLVVYVGHPGYLSELKRFWLKKMLANIQNKYPDKKIRAIKLQIDPEVK